MDLTNSPRHTHRSRSRWQAAEMPDTGLSRSETVDLLRLSRRNQRLGLSEPPVLESEPVEQCQYRCDSTGPLSWLADSIEEQAASSGDLAGQLKFVLNQCLLTEIAGAEGLFEAPGLSSASQTPQELLRAFARVVALKTGGGAEPSDHSNQPDGLPNKPVGQRLARVQSPPYLVANLIRKYRQRLAPEAETTKEGFRIERFRGGSEITKDQLGRVLFVHSSSGESISLHYDNDGNLDSFYRNDAKGRVHSVGKRDRHGVVIRDADGRARAAGESMVVDPHGCLSVHNHDGQMVSVDLVRGLHMERRRWPDGSGHMSTVTAVFAHDGFRMATHFHEVILIDINEPAGLNSDKVSPLRFYGRDGSMIEFASEDDLVAVNPQKVLPPGSLCVEPKWRGKRQSGTAWESVQEYLELLL